MRPFLAAIAVSAIAIQPAHAGEAEKLVKNYYKAYNAGDTKALRKLFADDATGLVETDGGNVKQDIAKIEEGFRHLETNGKGSKASFDIDEDKGDAVTLHACYDATQTAAGGHAWLAHTFETDGGKIVHVTSRYLGPNCGG